MNEKLSPKELFWISATILLGILIYGDSLRNSFVWDDHNYLLNNPEILSWSGLKDIWFHVSFPEYYPVTSSFLWLEHKLWGIHPWGYHTVSLTLHALNSLLLFSLLRKNSPHLAGILTLLFMIHPIQVETVAWISEQKTLLCTFFFFLGCRAFLEFDASNKKIPYAITLLLFIAALLSKSVAICFAFIPLLHAWWKRGIVRKRDFLIALPFFLIGGAASVFHLHLIKIFDAPSNIAESVLAPAQKFLLAGRVFFFYIRQILFPQSFMTIYPKWEIQTQAIMDWIYPLGVVALFITLFWKRRSLGRGFFSLLCFYAISLFPVLGFIDFAWFRFSYVADHFTYLSIPSVLLLTGLTISRALSMLKNRWAPLSWPPSQPFKKILSVLISLLIVYLSILSFRLSLNYRNNIVLWTHALRQNPDSSFPYLHLGEMCSTALGCSLDEAIALFQKSIRLKPDYLHPHMSLAERYWKKHDYENALTTYKHAAKIGKPFAKMLCYRFIASIYITQGKFTEALSYLERALALETNLASQGERRPLQGASTRSDLGTLYLMQGENHKAVRFFREAITLDSQQSNYYAGLGAALINLKDHKNAVHAFQKALDLDPQNTSLKKNLTEAQRRLLSPPM